MAALIIKSGARAGERIEVGSGVVIGREGADVTIDDPEISRRHVAVRPSGSGLEVEDLGSKNGTWVDDRRVETVAVTANGAVLKLGDTVLEVELEAETRVRRRPERATTLRRAAAEPQTATAEAPRRPGGPVQPFGAFSAGGEARRGRRVATRLWLPSVASFAAIAGTAAALIAYFAGR